MIGVVAKVVVVLSLMVLVVKGFNDQVEQVYTLSFNIHVNTNTNTYSNT